MVSRPKVRLGVALLAVLGLAVLNGCSSDALLEDPGAGYVEPAWMAEQRQVKAEYQAQKAECIRSMGATPHLGASGNVGIITKTGENDQVSPAQEGLNAAAAAKCDPLFTMPDALVDNLTPESYQRVVDVWRCIHAEGYLVEEPPSREAWEEKVKATDTVAWSPYETLYTTTDITDEQLFALMEKCQTVPFGAFNLVLSPW